MGGAKAERGTPRQVTATRCHSGDVTAISGRVFATMLSIFAETVVF